MENGVNYDDCNYTGDRDPSGKPSGFGRMEYPDGAVYEGQWANGLRQGKGTYTSWSGERYEGNWANDLAEGEGFKTFSNGFYMKGIFKDGKLISGIFNRADKEILKGTFDDEWFEGEIIAHNGKSIKGRARIDWKLLPLVTLHEAKWISSVGRKYYNESDYFFAIFDGKCVVTRPNGYRFEGYYKNGKKNGPCKETLYDGSIYEGYCVENKRTGQSKITFTNGAIVCGHCEDDVFKGPNGLVIRLYNSLTPEISPGLRIAFDDQMPYGFWNLKYVWNDGRFIEVSSAAQDRHDYGNTAYQEDGQNIREWKAQPPETVTLRFDTGDVLKYHQVRRISEVYTFNDMIAALGKDADLRIVKADGSIIEGHVNHNIWTDQVSIKWPHGDTFIGKIWPFDLKGTYTWVNGDSFKGEIVNGMCSKGTYEWANGDKYEGEFQRGMLHGGYGSYEYLSDPQKRGLVISGKWKENRPVHFNVNKGYHKMLLKPKDIFYQSPQVPSISLSDIQFDMTSILPLRNHIP